MSPIIIDIPADGATFLELQNQVLHDDFNPTKYRDLVKGWLNEALHRIYRTTNLADADNEQSITLTAGTATYALPSRSVRIESLRTAEGAALSEVPIHDIDMRGTATGEPSLYALVGDGIHLHPTPQTSGGVLWLRYRYNAADMVDDEDVPALDPDYRHLLVEYARSRAFRLEDDPQMAAYWFGEWQRDLQELRADLQRRSTGRIRQIPGMWGRPSRPTFQRP